VIEIGDFTLDALSRQAQDQTAPRGDQVQVTSSRGKEENDMNLPELAAHVALIADDAERRIGPEANPALCNSYAHEAVLDLWMTQPGITVAMANRMLRQVHTELQRRWRRRQEERTQRRVAREALLAELAMPTGHCPNHRSTRDLPGTSPPVTKPFHWEVEGTERSGALAAR
jgi:hypothetical protein